MAKVDIRTITDLLCVFANTYKQKYDEAQQTRVEQEKEAKKSFVPGSKAMSENMDRIREVFTKTILEAKRDFLTKAGVMIEDAKADELTNVRYINVKALEELNTIANMGVSISTEEMEVLADKYSSDYWAMKKVGDIALSNGIDINIEPNVSTRIGILEALADHCNKLTEWYKGTHTEDSAKVRELFLPQTMENAVTMYNGLPEGHNSTDKLLRIFINIRNATNDGLQADVIDNALRNIKNESERAELLYMLCTDENIKASSVSMSTFADEIQNFKENDLLNYDLALTFVERMRNVKDKYEVKNLIVGSGQLENGHFTNMLIHEGKKNSFIKSAYAEIKAEQEAEAKQRSDKLREKNEQMKAESERKVAEAFAKYESEVDHINTSTEVTE